MPVIVMLILEFSLDRPRSAEQRQFDGATADDMPGLVKPVLVKSVGPTYPSDAMRARIQGVVEVDIVVKSDGTVGAARVARSLDTQFGLDAPALDAVRAWLFRPGTLNGEAVPVLTRVNVTFGLQ